MLVTGRPRLLSGRGGSDFYSMIKDFKRLKTRLSRQSQRLGKKAWQTVRLSSTPAQSKKVMFVSGLQRSGTNMIMDFFDKSLETEVFHETDPRLYESYELRDISVVRQHIARSRCSTVVIKALLEAHKIEELFAEFPSAKLVWMFRHYDDVVNSYVRNWPGGRNQIEKIIVDRKSAEWRGKGMTDETHSIVREHYDPELNDASAIALFWYYRNQLFFDQNLDKDQRCMLIHYESLVQSPEIYGAALAQFSGITASPVLWSGIHSSSLRRRPLPDIDPAIRKLADGMLDSLIQALNDKERSQALKP